MGLLSDFLGTAQEVIGVKDAFSLYKEINQANLSKSFNNSQNTINELQASVELLRLQNQAAQQAVMNTTQTADYKKYLGYGALFVAAGVAVYLLVKK